MRTRRRQAPANTFLARRPSLEATSLFEPDVIMAEQLRHDRAWSPEQRLCVAVLEKAIRDLDLGNRSDTKNGARIRAEVLGWVDSPDEEWPFSFLSICDYLGVDPDALRRAVHARRLRGPLLAVVRPVSGRTKRPTAPGVSVRARAHALYGVGRCRIGAGSS